MILRADFEPLVSGESIIVKYKTDRETTWKETLIEDSVGVKEVRLPIKVQAKEIEVAVDLATSVSTAPTVVGISLEAESAESERGA